MSTLLERAVEYAAGAHVVDYLPNTDIEYTAHCLKVAEWVALASEDENDIAAAALHDVLKMTNREYGHLCQAFPVEVANMVDGLSLIGTVDQPQPINNIWLANFIDEFPGRRLWGAHPSTMQDMSFEINTAREIDAAPVLRAVVDAILKDR